MGQCVCRVNMARLPGKVVHLTYHSIQRYNQMYSVKLSTNKIIVLLLSLEKGCSSKVAP